MGTRTAARLGFFAVLATMGALLASPAAPAAVITPNTFNDENGSGAACSLREAILAANTDMAFGGCPAGGAADTIGLAAGTYGLSIPRGSTGDDRLDGDLYVASQLTITHTGVKPAAIDGRGLDRVIRVLGTGNLTASGFTIRNGRTSQSGGGIRNEGALNLSNATVAGNETTGSFGGGISNSGSATMSLTNVTISGNRAEGDGGGIDQGLGGLANLNNVTISGNTADTDGDAGGGGGVLVAPGTILNPEGTFTFRNTIIAGNHDISPPAVGEAPDCGGTLISHGHNLIGDRTGCGFAPRGGDKTNVNPRLGPLGNNGGSTFTYALLAGSPAIDGGGAGAAPTDQRGVRRRAPDIGAYERATCGGIVVNRVGTFGKDSLTGTSRSDGILGLGGKDTLKGRARKDGLCGGGGKDRLIGQGGRDVLIGAKGKDICKGGAGKDVEKTC
ncbi:MAG TPA: choice-of-anchor Q domain-containing protein [Solirubrobacterales bacterium]